MILRAWELGGMTQNRIGFRLGRGRRAMMCAAARWVFLVLLLGTWTTVSVARADDPSATTPHRDAEPIREAYREAFYRMPTSKEIQAWFAAEDEGTSRQVLVERLKASAEYREVRVHRREEARDLLGGLALLVVVYSAGYFLVVRGRPDRVLLFAVFVFMFTPLALDYDYIFQNAHLGDFPSFYYGADYIYNQGISPYGTTLNEEVESHIFPFFHPPPSVLVFYPWSHISYDTARTAAIVGNLIALCVLLYLIVVKDREDRLIASICFLVYILCFHPVRRTLDYGQINLWTTVFICLFIYGYVGRKRPALTGLSLACAVILKIYPAGLLAYLVLKRQWKAIAWCAAGIVACGAIGLITVPWSIWESWWQAVGSRGAYGDAPVGLFSPAGLWNQGLHGLVVRTFTDNQFSLALYHSPVLSKVVTYTLALLILGGAGGILWLRDRRGLKGAEELELGCMLVVMVVVVPLSWVHHAVMILPAIIAMARALLVTSRRWWWVLFAVSACIVGWSWAWLPEEDFRLFWGGPTVLLGSIRVFGLLGLLIVILAWLAEPLRRAKTEIPQA